MSAMSMSEWLQDGLGWLEDVLGWTWTVGSGGNLTEGGLDTLRSLLGMQTRLYQNLARRTAMKAALPWSSQLEAKR